jgi:hypothetical protein
MENMNLSNDITDEESIDPAILAILRELPCEQGAPSAESDLVIRRAAAARMAAVRRRARWKRVSATVAAMAACLLLGMYLINRSHTEKNQTVDLARDDAAIILREVSALFPGQIRAIHRDGTGLHLTLSESPDVDSTMAVVIEIGDNGDSRQIITFSGQTIEIMGRSVTVDADPNRGILLNGQDIEWWNTQHSPQLSIRSISI